MDIWTTWEPIAWDLNCFLLIKVTIDIETGEITTGIRSVALDSEIESVEYYDINGLRVQPDHKGFVLRLSRHADGTISTTKILNR